jgi:hypothetical protein
MEEAGENGGSQTMSMLVVVSSTEDQVKAEALRTGLEVQGYQVWREPPVLQVGRTPRTVLTFIHI